MSNDMKAVTISYFMVFFSYAINIVSYFLSVYVPNSSMGFINPDAEGSGLKYMLSTLVLTPSFSAVTLVLFTFSLLIMQLLFIKLLFIYGATTISVFVLTLPIPYVIQIPIIMGAFLAAYVGIMQMSSRQTTQGT